MRTRTVLSKICAWTHGTNHAFAPHEKRIICTKCGLEFLVKDNCVVGKVSIWNEKYQRLIIDRLEVKHEHLTYQFVFRLQRDFMQRCLTPEHESEDPIHVYRYGYGIKKKLKSSKLYIDELEKKSFIIRISNPPGSVLDMTRVSNIANYPVNILLDKYTGYLTNQSIGYQTKLKHQKYYLNLNNDGETRITPDLESAMRFMNLEDAKIFWINVSPNKRVNLKFIQFELEMVENIMKQ